jgi:hypothetical protein
MKNKEVDRACGTHGKEEKSLQGFGGNAQRKDATQNTKAKMGEWDQK